MDLVHEDAGDTAEDWDQRYVERGERMWSGQPNGALVAEVEGMAPGSVLDLGCGEGADAVWLAQRGWRVTGLEISTVALDRARQAAEDAGVEVEWLLADITTDPIPGRFDLVSAQYPAFRKDADGVTVATILDAVAPGGTLLFVHHSFEAEGGHRPEHFDPDAYLQPHDVAAALGDGWTVEADEIRPRVRPEGSPGPDVPDAVLRARRDA